MRTLKISTGGQVSVPADVRHRWKTTTVEFEDRGHELVLRPVTDDPIQAARGAFSAVAATSDELRDEARAEAAAREGSARA